MIIVSDYMEKVNSTSCQTFGLLELSGGLKFGSENDQIRGYELKMPIYTTKILPKYYLGGIDTCS